MKRIFLVAFLGLLSFSCSNDYNDKLTFDLEGKWTLYNVSCFCAFGDNPDFSANKITFNTEDLEVENAGEFQFFENAEGDYSVDGNVLTFADGNQYTFEVKLDRLVLVFVDEPGIADDEVTFEFIRG